MFILSFPPGLRRDTRAHEPRTAQHAAHEFEVYELNFDFKVRDRPLAFRVSGDSPATVRPSGDVGEGQGPHFFKLFIDR